MTRTRRARARAARGLNCQTCAVVAPGALELELPDGLDEAGALALLATRLRVQAARPRTADRVLLDTFDARLRAAGLRAEWPARRATVRKLALHEAGVAVRRADVADAPVALRALPPGPLRERLAPVLEERALLPLARVRSRTVSVAVLNDDDKTVARLVLERPTLVRGRATRRFRPGCAPSPSAVTTASSSAPCAPWTCRRRS